MAHALVFGDFFSNIYRYREYLKQSVARDLRRRYKRSVLGYFWSMLHPLLMMTVLAIVFSNTVEDNDGVVDAIPDDGQRSC